MGLNFTETLDTLDYVHGISLHDPHLLLQSPLTSVPVAASDRAVTAVTAVTFKTAAEEKTTGTSDSSTKQ